MNYITVEVEIDHGRIVARHPEKLPQVAKGILTIIDEQPGAPQKGERVRLPLIKGDGTHIINPTPEEVDASAWGD